MFYKGEIVKEMKNIYSNFDDDIEFFDEENDEQFDELF
jgi:hypothetical protein